MLGCNVFLRCVCVQKKLKDGVEAIIEGGDPSLPGVDDEEKELLKVGLRMAWVSGGIGVLAPVS